MQQFIVSGNRQRSDDISKDLSNPELTFVYVLNDKLEDDLVARLSELAEAKIGLLNFYFAAEKLGKFHDDVKLFSDYIARNGFRNCSVNRARREHPPLLKTLFPVSYSADDGNLP